VRGIHQHLAIIDGIGIDHGDGVGSQGREVDGSLGEFSVYSNIGRWIGRIVQGAVRLNPAAAVRAHGLSVKVVHGVVILGIHGPVDHHHQIAACVAKDGLQGDQDGILAAGVIHRAVEHQSHLGGRYPARAEVFLLGGPQPDFGGHVGQVGDEVVIKAQGQDGAHHTNFLRVVKGLEEAVHPPHVHRNAGLDVTRSNGHHHHSSRHDGDGKWLSQIVGGIFISRQHYLGSQDQRTFHAGGPAEVEVEDFSWLDGSSVHRSQNRPCSCNQLHQISALRIGAAVADRGCVRGGVANGRSGVSTQAQRLKIVGCCHSGDKFKDRTRRRKLADR